MQSQTDQQLLTFCTMLHLLKMKARGKKVYFKEQDQEIIK